MPGFDSYSQKIQYPKLGDTPNAETGFGTLVDGVAPLTNMVFPNANARTAAIPNPVVGMETYLVAEDVKEVYNGTSWVRYSKSPQQAVIQTGTVNISFSNMGSYTDTTVTFPTAFQAAPVVMVNLASGAGTTARWDVRAISVTATSFVPFCYTSVVGVTATWSTIPVQWIAVGTA